MARAPHSPSMVRSIAAVAVAASLAVLAGCGTAPEPAPGTDEIAAVDFRQSQALPDFDDGDYTQDDPAAIAELQALLDEYDIDPATWQGQDTGCAGNRVTQVTLRYGDGEAGDLAAQFSVDSCSDDPFEQAADELFTQWREELAA